MPPLTPDMMLPIALARLLRDGETVFHGVASPVPMVAILLAKRLHAPNLVYLNITGSI
ncbi:MAG: CoA-transferase, partial [Anaerolineae bacterium]|nr:CoA-transferase [Anaerolineae bacterium]